VEIVVLGAGLVCLVVGTVAIFAARARVRAGEKMLAAAQKRAAARVEAAELVAERLVQGLHAVPDAVVIVDRDGAELFRNRAATRFADPRHADAVAAQLLDRLIARALEGETCTRELPLFGPPREVLLVTAGPIVSDGVMVGATARVEDVTELRRVESVRRDFVANVSHELKTPIGALTLLAETIAAADDPESARGLFDQMVREADRLARIVDDLLDLSLIEAQQSPTRERMPLRVLLDEAVERVRAIALAKGIPIFYEPPTDDIVIACDPTQLVSAFTNLLDNAVKYSDERSSVEVGATDRQEVVAVWVRDRGIGIPSRDLERIFERFYRVDRARSRATGGTGLGLSIVRHVAQVHGGDITVESAEGEGSTFEITLPVSGVAEVELPERVEAV
jgi:two-component system sensor histidine kinase SenX3